jgi:hypothetical protein
VNEYGQKLYTQTLLEERLSEDGSEEKNEEVFGEEI